jgi:hypothetical protein
VEGKIVLLENKDIYPKLFKEVFGKECRDIPEVVKVAKTKGGVTIGFLAGHWELDGTFYIEYSGVLPEFRNKGWVRYIKLMLDPCINYLTAVENTNIVTGKTLYSLGFIPIGSRYHDNTFYIEWVRRGIKNG